MPLNRLQVPFVSGQDESRSSKVLPAPKMVRAENLRIDQMGEVQKVRGTKVLATNAPDSPSPTPRGPVRVFNHEDQLCVVGERALWTYSEAEDQLEEVEDVTTLTLPNRRSLGHYGAADVVAHGSAQINDFTVYAWVTYDRVGGSPVYQLHIMTVDNETGSGSAATAVTVDTPSSAGIRSLRLLPLGNKITVFWGETISASATYIRYVDITDANSGPYTATTGTTLVSDADQTYAQWYDVTVHGSGYLLAYHDGSDVVVTRYDSSHSSQATDTISYTGSAPVHLAVCGGFTDGTAIGAVCIFSDSNVKVARFDTSIGIVGTPYDTAYSAPFDTIDNLLGIAACTFLRSNSPSIDDGVAIVWNAQDSSNRYFCRAAIIANDSFSTSSAPAPDTWFIAKPVVHDEDVLIPIRYYTNQTNSYSGVVRFDPGYDLSRPGFPYLRPEIRVAANRGITSMPSDHAASVAYLGNSLKIPYLLVDRYSDPSLLADPTGVLAVDPSGRATGNQTISVVAVDGYEFELQARDRFLPAKVAGVTYLGGGMVTQFDGRRNSEVGFWSYPDVAPSDLSENSTGGQLSDGFYTYAFIWEWVDYLGNVHRSPPKIVQIELTAGTGTSSVTIALPNSICQTLKHWRLQGDDDRPVYLAIYSTDSESESAVGTDGVGSLLYRLEGNGVAGFPENDPTSFVLTGGSTTYTDTYDRDTIALTARELLYTSSLGANQLANVPPPPSRFICAHDGRLFGVNDEDPTQVWYSKLPINGQALAWNEALVIQFEEPVIQLVSQDGNLLAFTKHGVYTIVGRGADNTGGSTTYEPPKLLSSERGCTNARSVVAAPPGVFFKSQRGIELHPRGGAPLEFIGDSVRKILETYPWINDAYHNEVDGEVLFAVSNVEGGTGGAGRILAYDYRNEQWFVRTRASQPIVTMAQLGGNVVYGIYDTSGMTLWQEDSGYDEADSSFIAWLLEMGDLRLADAGQGAIGAGMLGNQRVHEIFVLGQAYDVETIRIRESRDSGNSWSSYKTQAITAAKNPLELRYSVRNPKGRSHRFEISSSAYGANVDSKGVGLVGLTILGKALGTATVSRGMEI